MISNQSMPGITPLKRVPPFPFHNLNLTMQTQQQSNWCWAAVAVSINLFYKPASTWTQCSVANAELGQTACCSDGSSPSCNQPWYLDKALTRVGDLTNVTSGTVPFVGISAEIMGGRPLGVRIGWAGGGGHFVAVSGFSASDQHVVVVDPIYGRSVVPVATLVNGYQGSGSWTHSYYTH